MKLVDILARELRVWPNDDFASIGQACNGTLHKSPNWSVDCGWTKEVYTIAEDWSRSYVTRAQWQAAVDALEAEVRPTESVALHYQEVGRITRQWNGDGLPPVGTVCEYLLKTSNQWHKCEIRYHMIPSDFGELRAIVWNPNLKFDQISNSNWEFRPLRTPEQIAAEERDKAIEGMIADTNILTGIMSDRRIMAGQLYDAGYRKFKIVDN